MVRTTFATGNHTDFGPWNTLVGSEGVTVIDFFGSREGPIPLEYLERTRTSGVDRSTGSPTADSRTPDAPRAIP